MKDWQSLILTVLLAWIVGYGIHDWRSRGAAEDFNDAGGGSAARSKDSNSKTDSVATSVRAAPSASSPPGSAAVPAAPGGGQPVANEDLARERFTQALASLGPCLQMTGVVSTGSVDPTLDNWLGAVRTELGEPVLQTEDWSTVEIKTASGEQRRIRLEMDYTGAERIVRRLKYTTSSGEAIPLTKEQSEDPTDTFIAGLEADGDIVGREKTQRIYFGGGEEIIVTEKNGKVADISMNRNGRTFQCLPYDTSPDSCKCHTSSVPGEDYNPPPDSGDFDDE